MEGLENHHQFCRGLLKVVQISLKLQFFDTKNKLYLQLGNLNETLGEWIPVELELVDRIWLPDTEILRLKGFHSLEVLGRLQVNLTAKNFISQIDWNQLFFQGLWMSISYEMLFVLATRIRFMCPMNFNRFPMDEQMCKFQVNAGAGDFDFASVNSLKVWRLFFSSTLGWVFQLWQYQNEVPHLLLAKASQLYWPHTWLRGHRQPSRLEWTVLFAPRNWQLFSGRL